ncbi:integral membrane protein [Aspergillus sp. HF37]|nr:integral membrane protein [Aspergillus sp. HF37]
MLLFSRIVSIALRVGQVISAVIVAGIVGHDLDQYYQIRGWPQARWIYTEVIAGLSILFGLIWSIPFAAGFFAWPLDFILSLAWFASFGVLVDFLNSHTACEVSGFFFDDNFGAPLSICGS